MNDVEDAFANVLAGIHGASCWSVIAGKGTGSTIDIGFRGKIKRDKPLRNATLTEQEQLFEAEFSLLVHCAWRLTSRGKVRCSWRDSNDPGGPMLRGLSAVRGARLVSAELDVETCDLSMLFDNENRLDIFCDQTDPDEADQNYLLFTPEQIFVVRVPANLSVEERRPRKLVLHQP